MSRMNFILATHIQTEEIVRIQNSNATVSAPNHSSVINHPTAPNLPPIEHFNRFQLEVHIADHMAKQINSRIDSSKWTNRISRLHLPSLVGL